jgi:eukaryotic-like serine/threonine-protein kinase
VRTKSPPSPDVSDEFTRYGKEWHARVLYALGRFDEAEGEWRDLAAECDRLLGPDHLDSIDAHENHALTLAMLDRVAEAEAEMASVVEKYTAGRGSDAATLRSRTSQAVYLSTLGRLAESEAAWRGLAEAKGRVLGADHADTILAREALAAALYDQRRLQEAAAEYGEVAALRAATVGADHPDTERAGGWQADIQRELNGPDQASIAD